jgi:hypothetical protein
MVDSNTYSDQHVLALDILRRDAQGHDFGRRTDTTLSNGQSDGSVVWSKALEIPIA